MEGAILRVLPLTDINYHVKNLTGLKNEFNEVEEI